VRLKSLGIGTLHVLTHTSNTAGIHRIMGQSTFLKKVLKVVLVNSIRDYLR
jgi:hypothetical protein